MDPKTSDAILARLTRLHPKKIDLTLGRTLGLLEKLGRPQDKLPPVIHVGGTNGKGSTVAFLRAILQAAGYKVHAFTSPHLVRFNERIRLANNIIDENQLTRILGYCEMVNDGEPITFFEITTAAAFKAFAETPADVVLLEVGLGGWYDSTNVVDHPALTVITPVSLDHMQFLGPDIPTIAFDKAHIMKPGVPCVLGEQTAEAVKAIQGYADTLGVKTVKHGVEWSVNEVSDGIRVRHKSKIRQFPHPALLGPHQIHNAGLAVTCTEYLKTFNIPSAAIAEGLKRAEWPARLQKLKGGPIFSILPEGCEVWLDGGHNASAGQALAAVARNWRDRPLHLIFATMKSRDPAEFLRPLAPYTTAVQTLTIPGEEGSHSAEDAAASARTVHIRATAVPDLEAAAANIAKDVKGPARILICGSLYLAGSVLAQHG